MATVREALAMAVAHHQAGRLQVAEQIYRQVLALEPDHADALHLLGIIAHQGGKHEIAIEYIGRAISRHGTNATFHNNLGDAYRALGRFSEAIASYRRALQLEPNFSGFHYNLGLTFKDTWQLPEAIACYERVLQLEPNHVMAHNNLGNALQAQGQVGEAIACFRRALELKPDYRMAHSNLVYALHFCPDYDARTIYEEHQRWNQAHAEPLARFIEPHANDPTPERRLRIGYVSPDWREHPIGRFMLPLLEAHDHESFEIICYSGVRFPDTITHRCRAHADGWRDVPALSDEHLADLIREDQIDILVDLTMHMAGSRLLVFARKPAPVQVTYLAYCGTTGLSTMDYRLTDPYLDPPGPVAGDRVTGAARERIYSEQSIWLPETYWCYRPVIPSPPVTPVPARQDGRVTFGCLNSFTKVSEAALAAWSRLLEALPRARLLLHAPAGNPRARVLDFLARHNISPERLDFVGLVPAADYFRLYERMDVALDPFPYGGGTTTCDALWMGVPVVSLAGQTGVGRGGLSLLSNVGLPELVARDAEQYIRISLELAGDPARLNQLRATLRERMEKSPLMNAARFARNIEASYRKMWTDWCAKRR
jgi:predicted O-linked N-acetylglucosamine transferase (SPINDLY family)